MKNKISKIIYILHHTPNPIIRDYKTPEDLQKSIPYSFEYTKIDRYPYWVGFFKNDFHDKLAREVLKRTDKYQIECWRPYGNNIREVYTKEVEGVLHRVFPLKETRMFYIGYFGKSKEMLVELKKEIRENNVLIHIHDGHSRFINWLILKLKKEKVPIVYQQRSSSFGIFKYRSSARKYNVTNLFVHWKQLQTLRYISLYYTVSQVEKKYLSEKIKVKNIDFMKDGVDFSFFKPAEHKKIPRKELGLPEDKILILYVGRFYKDKNVDILLKCFQRIKEKNKKIELLMVGGYKSDQFYKMGQEAGAILIERIQPGLLIKYYQAADIYVLPTFGYTVVNFGGFGTAPAEALACGLPIITNNIIHFPGTREERDKIGISMETEDIFERNLEYMLHNLDKFKECREIAQKYFDVNVTQNILLTGYAELFRQYYGN